MRFYNLRFAAATARTGGADKPCPMIARPGRRAHVHDAGLASVKTAAPAQRRPPLALGDVVRAPDRDHDSVLRPHQCRSAVHQRRVPRRYRRLRSGTDGPSDDGVRASLRDLGASVQHLRRLFRPAADAVGDRRHSRRDDGGDGRAELVSADAGGTRDDRDHRGPAIRHRDRHRETLVSRRANRRSAMRSGPSAARSAPRSAFRW